tara:strand:+ start:1931 stop:2287 length:357 start_codon:yes stop_codon:yes gene_type:complete
MIPDDLWRHVVHFLRVEGAVNLEVAISKRLNPTDHYKALLYKQSYFKTYDFNNRKIHIDTYNLSGTLFSQVKPLPKREFVIRHKEKLSTKEANRKAYNVMCQKENRVLRRRLEMVGLV